MSHRLSHLHRYFSFQRQIVSPETRALDQDASEFLESLLNGVEARSIELPAGTMLWRAQEGAEFDDERGTLPLPPSRMKPTPAFAGQNRASARGVPMLYLATDAQTAMSELRPRFKAELTVAEFRTNRPMRIVDSVWTSEGFPLYFDERDDVQTRSEAAWGFVSHAFSKPVQSGRDEEYRLTQFVASTLRERGFDGIRYKSVCTPGGTNLAAFDLECADVVALHTFTARSVQWEFQKDGPSQRVVL